MILATIFAATFFSGSQPATSLGEPVLVAYTNKIVSSSSTNYGSNVVVYDGRYTFRTNGTSSYGPQWSVTSTTNVNVDSVQYIGPQRFTNGLILWQSDADGYLNVRYSFSNTNAVSFAKSYLVEGNLVPNGTASTVLEGTLTNTASMVHRMWTNIVTVTNANTTPYIYSDGLPHWRYGYVREAIMTNPPTFTYNTNCPIYGMLGATAISHFNSVVGCGQLPFTLITKRHAVSAGHSTVSYGTQASVTSTYAGQQVYYNRLTNETVVGYINERVSCYGTQTNGEHQDFCLIMFTNDIVGIDPMPMISYSNYTRFYGKDATLRPIRMDYRFATEQAGECYIVGNAFAMWPAGPNGNVMVGGDSGSPDMLGIPTGTNKTQLVMYSARTALTLGATPFLQTWIDTLTTRAGLNTNDYQITLYPMTGFPDIP